MEADDLDPVRSTAQSASPPADPGRSWRPLAVLGVAQFLMVLDSAVMNVSVTQLVEDFDTEVTAIQAVITFYSLVMAAFMITGGKIGDRIGRRTAFRLGLIVYGAGSILTAAAGSVAVLLVGWSILEGVGAAMVLPALAALVGGTYTGTRRVIAYGVLGGAAGAGVAVGPILGGFATTNLSWRWVFVGEAVIVVGLLVLSSWLFEPARTRRPTVDLLSTALSAVGLGLVVLAVLQSTSWGWLEPRESPVEPFGFSLTPFCFLAGVNALWLFAARQRQLERRGRDPLVDLSLLSIRPLRAGLAVFGVQNFALLGVFFTIPLYLQLTQGLDAFETGLRLLPVSLTMLVVALSGPVLLRLASPRTIVRTGLVVVVGAGLLLVSTIGPDLDGLSFALAVGVLGTGMGLLASQLGNIVQSSADDEARSEVGGLQYTAQNLGSALGTAFVGAVLIGTLTTAFITNIEADPALAAQASRDDVATRLHVGLPFVDAEAVAGFLAGTALAPADQRAAVDAYERAQLRGLHVAILAVCGLSLLGLVFTRDLPSRRTQPNQPAQPTDRAP